jgi:hypothetical protein
MKIAAILVTLALFLLPTFTHAGYIVWLGLQGKEDKLSKPLSKSSRKKFFIAVFVYLLVILPISISWALYVFTSDIWSCAIVYFFWVIIIAILVLIQRHMSSTLPKPPEGRWPDEKTRLDAIAKWRDTVQEQRYKETESIVLGRRGWRFYAQWIIGIILAIWGSAITIVALWSIIAPGPDDSLGTSISVMIIIGILPLTGGIALCRYGWGNWIIGIILSLFSIAMIALAVGDMISTPPYLPLAANIALLLFTGILPLAGGIALCVHDVKKRRKLKVKQSENLI